MTSLRLFASRNMTLRIAVVSKESQREREQEGKQLKKILPASWRNELLREILPLGSMDVSVDTSFLRCGRSCLFAHRSIVFALFCVCELLAGCPLTCVFRNGV